MPRRVLALNINGDMTYCTCAPDQRGKGRCNHVAHQMDGESPEEFLERVEALIESGELQLGNVVGSDDGDPFGDSAFIPYEGTTVTTRPYRMTDEDKEQLVKIENRMQLEREMGAGYIELETPLWNDMDKNWFCQQVNVSKKSLNDVLYGNAQIILDGGNGKLGKWRILPNDTLEDWKEHGYPRGWDPDTKLGSGVLAVNQWAMETVGFEPTRDVYVVPYWMRMGISNHVNDYDTSASEDAVIGDLGEEVSSDITVGYKYLLRTHANPDRQQIAYDALLNNGALPENLARWGNGFRNSSLADEFAGKGGVFRAVLSAGSIPYTGRAVAIPNANLKYGELAIPSSMAVDIFRPTILRNLSERGMSNDQIDAWIAHYRIPQQKISPRDKLELEEMIKDKRVAMNRQPSLHKPSFQSYHPIIASGVSVEVNPLYCKGYNLDFDGDEVHVYAFNNDDIIPVVDRSIDANLDVNTHLPRQQSKSTILPSKDAMFGLLSILQAAENA